MTEPLILTYRNGQWEDQHGRKVVNDEVMYMCDPGMGWCSEYEWIGTYEVVPAQNESLTSLSPYVDAIQLIAPISGSDVPAAGEGKTDLLNCPFCGGKPELIERPKHNEITIKCTCGIKYSQRVLRYSMEWLLDKMIVHWNTRKP